MFSVNLKRTKYNNEPKSDGVVTTIFISQEIQQKRDVTKSVAFDR